MKNPGETHISLAPWSAEDIPLLQKPLVSEQALRKAGMDGKDFEWKGK